MNATTYLLILIISFLGIGAGAFISYIAKEELKAGEIYFKYASYFTFALILGMFLKSFNIKIYIIVPAVLIMFAVLVYVETYPAFLFSVLGVALAFTAKNNALFGTTASLIFIYGIVSATLQARQKPMLSKVPKILLHNAGYILLGLVYFII